AVADGPGLDPIQEGIRLFNEEYFFEAHEVLEEVWRQEHGEPRLFLQGLIQVCAAYHHFQNGNLAAAITPLQPGPDKMRPSPPQPDSCSEDRSVSMPAPLEPTWPHPRAMTPGNQSAAGCVSDRAALSRR